VDTRGTQDHYSIQIVSNQFAGKSLVEQHRMVQAAISPLFNEGLHAIEIFTKVPK
jgi:BolA protein